jgi:tetratricopeptide (TPR) repeat protein
MGKRNDNFVDKTFTILADILLRVLPADMGEKEAFSYYRYGMSSYSKGEYAEALENYYESLALEEDPYDRSYVLYNVGLIYMNNGNYSRALDYYEQALDLNPCLPQALNNMGVIYHQEATRSSESRSFEEARECFERARKCWNAAIALTPNGYTEAKNWMELSL